MMMMSSGVVISYWCMGTLLFVPVTHRYETSIPFEDIIFYLVRVTAYGAVINLSIMTTEARINFQINLKCFETEMTG